MPGVARLYIVASALALATMAGRLGWLDILPPLLSGLVFLGLLLSMFVVPVLIILLLVYLFGAVTLTVVRHWSRRWKLR